MPSEESKNLGRERSIPFRGMTQSPAGSQPLPAEEIKLLGRRFKSQGMDQVIYSEEIIFSRKEIQFPDEEILHF